LSDNQAAVSLRTVADRVGLAVCSVSAILNNTPASKAIPQRTKDRVFRAVAELNYHPNLWARSLRTKRTRLVAAITSDIGLAPIARVLAGVQMRLHRRGYLLALGTLDCGSEWHNIAVALDIDFVEPLAENTQAWLSQLGESAVETVLRQIIEKKTVPRRVTIVPKLPQTYVAPGNAGLGAAVMRRERA